MIIGDNRRGVIKNIKKAAESGDFYAKVETGDPCLTKEQSDAIVSEYLKRRGTVVYKIKAAFARRCADLLTFALNRDTEIIGMEKLRGIPGGAIVTSNHFSPIENTCIRLITKKMGKKRINIVSQETNLAMKGAFGFLMNYADIIPISSNLRYVGGAFATILEDLLKKDEYILIYPEQEMWFNYRKPRPPKRGPFYYAARFNVPVICCFVEMRDMERWDTDEFKKVQFAVHILDVIYPDPDKSVKENSEQMCAKDYTLKKQAYEKIYGKSLNYTFDNSDIAGWTGEL